MADQLPRKLAAVFYADVVDYSRLTGADENATHRRLSEYLDLVSDLIARNEGKVIHYAGDAVLADFSTVTSALECASAFQNELSNRNRDLPDDCKVQFRIGIPFCTHQSRLHIWRAWETGGSQGACSRDFKIGTGFFDQGLYERSFLQRSRDLKPYGGRSAKGRPFGVTSKSS
ncbi:MAG: adenylate/guanylate cyclase domain-containing protein [Gammaproteobacteria bacterium]|nr:adenylate/guanylate cyclase domain-containing protein [Gammaproteobacteria bacterium]